MSVKIIDMKKTILGLDLGTNSIGWALIEVDNNNNPIKIIAMGSRIIPLNADDRDQFQKGQAISKNKERTTRRTQRKGYDRQQLKKSNLKVFLKNLNILPSDELLNLPMIDLWALRSNAASESKNITPQELGRIFYMLNQKRGYKSARSEANADKKETDYVQEVKGRYSILQEKGKTIGQYFYDELRKHNSNDSYFRIKDKVFPREAYIEEFDTIVNIQKQKHSFLTPKIIQKLRNEIIYYQRSLKSQKDLIRVCEYEGFETTYFDKKSEKNKTIFTGPKVAPRSSPLFQISKIWELVNNISFKIKSSDESKSKWIDKILSIEEKQQIVNYLSVNENLSFTELINILGLKKEDVYVNKQISKGLQGNLTYSAIKKIVGESNFLKFELNTSSLPFKAHLFDKKTGQILDERESLKIDASLEKEPFYQLWHTIYSIKELDECKKALMKRFCFDEKIADELSRLDFNKQSYGNKSNKAMRKMLPYLMLGYQQSQAESFAGYNRNLTNEEKNNTIFNEKLELLPKNSLRQPVVEKILNQMINVVNAIVDKYGKPFEIRVELARELKQSKEERERADKQNTINKKLNDEVIARLKELNLPTTKRYIQKYKFIFPAKDKNWKEAQVVNQCIYCGESFNISDALSGDNFDVDHIVPRSMLFDDSQTNKVLVHRHCNSAKTNTTAYDYISKKGIDELDKYIARVEDWFKRGIIGYGKMQRLKVSFEEYQERKKNKKETELDKKIWELFIDRQLRETAYISRKAKEILVKICGNVTSTEGSVTAKLREVWGWDDVLMNLQMTKYKMVQQTQIKKWTSEHGKRTHEKEQICNWSKRDDHRHHAIDALVIACTQQGFIQRINTLSSSETKDAMQKEIELAKKKYGMNFDQKILNEKNEIIKGENEKINSLNSYLISRRPEIFNTNYIQEEAEKILISFKAGKRVTTISRLKATGKNLETGILVPRGALHEQFVYGKIKVIEKDKNLKYLLEHPSRIMNTTIKNLIKERLNDNGNDAIMALTSIKKNPIYIDEVGGVVLEKSDCFKEEVVIKYKLQDLKAKDVPFIIDKKIKSLVQMRLDSYNGNEKEAFKNVLWFNESKQIPILTVRCYTGLKAVETIKLDEKGNSIGFAKPGNNHHIAIYKDLEGKYIQHLCTFWHAVERKKFKIDCIINDSRIVWNSLLDKDVPESFLEKLPPDNLNLEYSLQENEMFVLGLRESEFQIAIKENNNVLLSKHLYLVWSISFNKFWFRHHLETKNSELKKTEGARESKRFIEVSSIDGFLKLSPVKVRLNHLGELTKIGE